MGIDTSGPICVCFSFQFNPVGMDLEFTGNNALRSGIVAVDLNRVQTILAENK